MSRSEPTTGSLDRSLTVHVVRPLWFRGVSAQPGGRGIPILMYHRIADDSEASVRPYFRLATSPARFAAQMSAIAASGCRGVSVEAALAAVDRGDPERQRMVVITFDDGYLDFLEHAQPALARHGFTATVYLPTAYIGRERREFRGYPCLEWSEVAALRRSGIQFGSHTVNHPVLHRMPWGEIREELVRSRATLEDELSEPIDAFAYPYAYPEGDVPYVDRFEGLLAEVGYTNSSTTRIGCWRGSARRLALPRLPVNQCDDAPFFAAKLAGAYDWMGTFQQVAKRVRHWLKPVRRDDSPGTEVSAKRHRNDSQPQSE